MDRLTVTWRAERIVTPPPRRRPTEARPEGGGLLTPETQRSLIVGLKAASQNGRAEFDVDGFFVNFDNQPVEATANGTAVLRSIGEQRYKGMDVEGLLRPVTGLSIKANIGWSDAVYEDYVTDIDGQPTQLAGRHQVLTPRVRVGGGVLYAPSRGWRGSLTANWIGTHWLNSLNTFEAPAYAVIDASLGYRFEKFTVTILGSNLGDRRDAVQLSELGEGQFYRLLARRIDATLTPGTTNKPRQEMATDISGGTIGVDVERCRAATAAAPEHVRSRVASAPEVALRAAALHPTRS